MASILVVDDEKGIRITLRKLLVDAGYDVDIAKNADGAMEILSKKEVDLILADIIMHGTSGVELLKNIKKMSPYVQVILMTGEPTVKTASEAVRAGAFDYLSKPIRKEQLLRTVANAAKVKSLDDERHRLAKENRRYQENLERLVGERTAALQVQMEAQKFLLGELDHRVRNNLGSILSLIELSRNGVETLDEFASAIHSRIKVIESIHNILSSACWSGSDLETMFLTIVQPNRNTRIQIDGPSVLIPLGQAQAMGLVINELATNSLKYGAMSVDDAVVSISWSTWDSEDGNSNLKLVWCETGGPPIETEPKPGVGVELIHGISCSELGGHAELTYPVKGVLHAIYIKLAIGATAQFNQPNVSPSLCSPS